MWRNRCAECLSAAVGGYLKRNDRVMELGCGTGSTAMLLAPYCESIVATDFAEGMISIAREKQSDSNGQNIFFEQAEATHCLELQAFDVAMAFSLLHLVEDIRSVLAAARAQRKPGGLFLTKTVCLGERGLLLKTALGCISKLPIGPKLNFLTQEKLFRDMEAAGFEIEKIVFFGGQRFDPFIVARLAG